MASPTSARGQHLSVAKTLVHEMPHILAALECGRLSEWRATLIARESACLDVEDGRALDCDVCVDLAGLDRMGHISEVEAAIGVTLVNLHAA